MQNMEKTIPYGNNLLVLDLITPNHSLDLLLPANLHHAVHNEFDAVDAALSSPLGISQPFLRIDTSTRVAITINDKTRPVPNTTLLTPLLSRLHAHGVRPENITIFIASGTHVPMVPGEYHFILDPAISSKYRIIPHNCDDTEQLYAIGHTSRRTPVYVNKSFFQNDLKIVVGDIELHHFAGYSGGVKSAAIGLSGRETINHNHKFLLDENACLAKYDENPLRADIEEIGRMMKIDLALNAVLNEKKQILNVFFGTPVEVMKAGINLINSICQTRIQNQYDLVVASAGGYPKDINLYQAQKAMTHGSMFCKTGGVLVLIAECIEGVGSNGYLDFMKGLKTVHDVIRKFSNSEFQVGPHKGYQVARIMQKQTVYLYSSLPSNIVESLLFKPLETSAKLSDLLHGTFARNERVAVLPYATACIPLLD